MKTLKIGPNAVTAKTATALIDIFNGDNCAIVYKADGLYKSWVPGRSLNAITETEEDVGYIAIMHQILDVSENFISTADMGNTTELSVFIIDNELTSEQGGDNINVGIYDAENNLIGEVINIVASSTRHFLKADMPENGIDMRVIAIENPDGITIKYHYTYQPNNFQAAHIFINYLMADTPPGLWLIGDMTNTDFNSEEIIQKRINIFAV